MPNSIPYSLYVNHTYDNNVNLFFIYIPQDGITNLAHFLLVYGL